MSRGEARAPTCPGEEELGAREETEERRGSKEKHVPFSPGTAQEATEAGGGKMDQAVRHF